MPVLVGVWIGSLLEDSVGGLFGSQLGSLAVPRAAHPHNPEH